MPSPFPGMDPFIEAQEWNDFHVTLNVGIRELLTPQLQPTYTVRVERRVYVEHPFRPEEPEGIRIADVPIIQPDSGARQRQATAVLANIEPVPCVVVQAEEQRESYLVIRDAESQRVVTVIETLSPANKRYGGDGWTEYGEKRQQILASDSHLVEIDLLRGGTRMPVRARRVKLTGDYRIMVSRAGRRPNVDVYAWPLLHQLPKIPVPLIGKEENVLLDLQSAFTTVYDRAAYELSLDYTAGVEPPLADEVKSWLQGQLAQMPK
jgi:hypothetical protein